MDDSHLHGPTVLAPIIGLASVETRVDHGEPVGLGTWLQERCRQGFDLPEAEHLCQRIYYRFEGIPMALRAQLSRATLAALFAELARLGWIRTARGNEQFAVDPEHWRKLLTPDYRRVGPVYDEVLGEAAFGRLQPRPGQVEAHAQALVERTT
jgi:hypothetical protein